MSLRTKIIVRRILNPNAPINDLLEAHWNAIDNK